MHLKPHTTRLSLITAVIMVGSSLGSSGRQPEAPSPFGVGSSAEASGRFGDWMPKCAAAGARWVRLFPDWNQIEPARGKWDWSLMDSMLSAATSNHLSISGLFLYTAGWLNTDTHNFPTNDYPAWSEYVSNVVRHAAGRVRYWEVWNEPENFAPHGTVADYARIVTNAYNAAKAVTADAQVGLSVASVDVRYLEQTIRAGAADHFDFICVHPYEVLGTVASGQEPLFMSIVPTLRKMLAAVDPSKAKVPIWFTELGEELGKQTSVTRQAEDLIKAYTMSIAQGVRVVEWFEAAEGGYKMGLLDAQGHVRPAYRALKSLTSVLGSNPAYSGWVLLNSGVYGFVFHGATNTAMVAWAFSGQTVQVSFEQAVTVVDPLSDSPLHASGYAISNSPVFVLTVPGNLMSQAAENRLRPFPWGGDYSKADSVSMTAGKPNDEKGLHQLNYDASVVVTVAGAAARDCSRSSSVAFTVDPNFISYTHVPLQISAVVRGISSNLHPGFNLKYESVNGRKGIGWNFVPGADRWYTLTWTLGDDEFVGSWGYHFSFDSDSTEHSRYYLQRVTVTKLVPPGPR